jgi:transcriptional regulator with XRE-family HTH domain
MDLTWTKRNTRARVARMMKERGLSLAQVAARCGVTEQAVRNWLSGEVVPRFNQAEKLTAMEREEQA